MPKNIKYNSLFLKNSRKKNIEQQMKNKPNMTPNLENWGAISKEPTLVA